jgi:hypothetical protein
VERDREQVEGSDSMLNASCSIRAKGGGVGLDKELRKRFDRIWSEDRLVSYEAFMMLLKLTEQPVDWAYDVWDELLEKLTDKDNHHRAIAAQLLCRLAKSDPEQRMLKDYAALLRVTFDERFVTARHTMQSLWQVGAAGKKQQSLYVKSMGKRFKTCGAEQNGTLIRFDIQQAMRNLYDAVKDEKIKTKALAWIETEPDPIYKKKYATVWKK